MSTEKVDYVYAVRAEHIKRKLDLYKLSSDRTAQQVVCELLELLVEGETFRTLPS